MPSTRPIWASGMRSRAACSRSTSTRDLATRSPAGMKSALGENPKRTYSQQKKTPSTRLGTAAVIRGALVDAANYLQRIEAEQAKPEGERKPVDRDLKLEALGLVLRG